MPYIQIIMITGIGRYHLSRGGKQFSIIHNNILYIVMARTSLDYEIIIIFTYPPTQPLSKILPDLLILILES